MVCDWFEIANSCLGMVSNILLDVFGNVQMLTKSWTLDLMYNRNINKKSKRKRVFKHVMFNISQHCGTRFCLKIVESVVSNILMVSIWKLWKGRGT